MNNNLLGKRIRAARGDESLRDFAKKCGISHTHLDSIEKGFDPRTNKKVSATLATLEKISHGSGLSLDYLLGKENPPQKEEEGTVLIGRGGARITLSKEEEELLFSMLKATRKDLSKDDGSF